jgi:hypothetical protein
MDPAGLDDSTDDSESNRMPQVQPRRMEVSTVQFEHPKLGVMQTYMSQGLHNSRLIFDVQANAWVKMPLAWESTMPEVKEMLLQLEHIRPNWKSVKEQLLVLRECNYNLDVWIHACYFRVDPK